MRLAILAISLTVVGCHTPSTAPAQQARRYSGIRPELRAAITRLRVALRTGAGVIDAVTYPFRVNTASRCAFSIQDRRQFLQHYRQIVDAEVEQAILASDRDLPEIGGPGPLGVRDGRVWVDVADGGKVTFVFSPRTWKLADLPCNDEEELPPDVSLAGTWVPSSVCETSDRFVAPSVVDSVTINPDVTEVTFTERSDKQRTCAVDRYSVVREDRFPTEEYHCGAEQLSESPALTLNCSGKSDRLYVSRGLTLFVGLQVVRLSRRLSNAKDGIVREGGACGMAGNLCAPGLVCSSRMVGDALDEQCRKLGSRLSP